MTTIKTWRVRISGYNIRTRAISEVECAMQAEIDELRTELSQVTTELEIMKLGAAKTMQEFMRENTKLRAAAIAVIDRWDTPHWKAVPATAEYIGRLRAALVEKP